jgi:hypothetical protein
MGQSSQNQPLNPGMPNRYEALSSTNRCHKKIP